jgi:catechol 2,3-dioxygenase-like lactoylglutathione lyase family enzyme
MNLKLEAIIIPVSDVDRAKKFYQEALGFRVDVDHRAAVYEEALSLQAPRGSELSHCAADAAGVGMFDSDRRGNHAGEAGLISGDVPDFVRHRGHAG